MFREEQVWRERKLGGVPFNIRMVRFKMPVIHLYGSVKKVVGYIDLKFRRYI